MDVSTLGETERQPAMPVESRRVTLWSGVLIAILGLVAILVPFVTGIALSLILGALLVVGGIAHVAQAFSARKWAGFAFEALLGIVYVVGGVALLANPVLGLLTLTLLIVGFLVVDGIIEVVMGVRLRKQTNGIGLVISGVLSLVLAGLVWLGFPSSARWAVGVLFGVSLLSTGVAVLLLATGTESEDSSLGEQLSEAMDASDVVGGSTSTAGAESMDTGSFEDDEDRGGATGDDE